MIFKILRFALYKIFRSTKPRLTVLILIIAIIFSSRADARTWLSPPEQCAVGCCLAIVYSFLLIQDAFIYRKKEPPKQPKEYGSILIMDAETETVVEKDKLSEANWGQYSTAAVGDKVVMGRGESAGNSILIVDVEKETVTEIGGLSEAQWGRNSAAAAGSKVIMGGTSKLRSSSP